MLFKDIIDHCLAAGVDPCALIKAAVIQGISLDEIAKAFMDECLIDPEPSVRSSRKVPGGRA